MSSPSVTITLKNFFDISDLVPQHLAPESNAKLEALRDVLSRRAPDVAWPAALAFPPGHRGATGAIGCVSLVSSSRV